MYSGFYQWYQWYTNIVQGSTNGTIGNTIGTNGNANGTIGSPNSTISTIGKPMVPLVTNGTIGKITYGAIGRTPNRATLSLLSRSFSDHHLRCGGWLNLEFSKREKHSGWAIKTIYKK